MKENEIIESWEFTAQEEWKLHNGECKVPKWYYRLIKNLLTKERYEPHCSGCGHHDSMWKTLVNSPQWTEWGKEQSRRFSTDVKEGVWDYDEASEIGCMSPDHFQGFLDWLLQKEHEFMVKKLEELNDKYSLCTDPKCENREECDRANHYIERFKSQLSDLIEKLK